MHLTATGTETRRGNRSHSPRGVKARDNTDPRLDSQGPVQELMQQARSSAPYDPSIIERAVPRRSVMSHSTG